MSVQSSRRQFLQAATGAAVLGAANFEFVSRLPVVTAAETQVDPKLVRNGSELEPLVRLIETTSKDQLLEAVAERIRKGASYREVLGALFLASVRNVQPRPAVGFKFHAVLVINSAHLASLSSPEADRWLPIFWALDYYKGRQLEEERASGWKLPPVKESDVPPAHKARRMFLDAMDRWDEPAADAAVAALARTAGANELFEIFSRYGARDFRAIGHKAIFVANGWRTLQCIGWQHAEPVLRSLAYALLNHQNEPNPSEGDLTPDRPGRANHEFAQSIRAEWLDGDVNEQATRDLLSTLRQGSYEDSTKQAVELLNRGVSPQSVWDAVFLGSGEVLMRQPGIVGLHTLTTANALHYAFEASGDDANRRFLLLQACAFLPMFREAARGRGKLKDTTLDELQPQQPSDSAPSAALEEIFTDVSRDTTAAASKILGFVQEQGDAKAVIDAARRMVFLKGNDAHDYKFSSAVLEDYYHVSPALRDRFLALSAFNFVGSGQRDNPLVERTRQALSGPKA